MKTSPIEDGVLIEHKPNSIFLSSMIEEFSRNQSITYQDDDIRCGIEVEFYLDHELPMVALNKILKYDLAVFANKIAVLPMAIEKNKEPDVWYVERDLSLDANDFGFEVVSPLMPLRELPFYLDTLLSIIRQNGFTTDSCGLHIHLSSTKEEEFDFVKLMTFMSENNPIADWSDRTLYAKDIVGLFKNSKTNEFREKSGKLSRYYTVNQINNSHVELRCFGGADYEQRNDKILSDFHDFLLLYKSALNKADRKEEYEMLLSKKNDDEAAPAVEAKEIAIIAKDIMDKAGHFSSDALEIAFELFEEDRLVDRDQIMGELYAKRCSIG